MASRFYDMALLNDDAKLSNPRAASVRIAADTMSGYSGQRRHDLRIGYKPAYVDSNRTTLNRILIAPPKPAEMRAIAQARRAQRETRRAMKSNAAIATSGIITFGSEAAQMFEALTPEQQDQAFRDLAEAVTAHLGTSLHALVIHLDEATIHAHFAMCAYGHDGHPLSRTSRPGILSELQDLTAEVLQRYCPEIERGTRYGDRLAAGADWADVIHKSVKELHRTLPADLAAKRAALAELADTETLTRDRVADTKGQLERLENTADRVREDMTRLEADKTELTDSIAGLKTRKAEVETALAESDRQAEEAARSAEEKRKDVADVATQLDTLTTTLAELAAAETIARARVKEMQDRVDALTRKQDLNDKEVKRLAIYEGRLKDRIAELETSRAAAQAARIAEEDKVLEATATAAAKRQEAEAIAAQVDTSRATLAALAEKEGPARERVTEIEAVIAGLTLTADRTGQDVKRLRDEKKALSDRLAALAAEKLAAEAAREEADRQAAESARIARDRREEVAAVSAEVEGARTTLAELAQAETTARVRVDSLEGQHADLELNISLARSEVAHLDRNKQALCEQVDEAERARAAAETARREEEEKAAEAIRKADTEKAETARAVGRTQVVTAGLAALAEEMAAGTLRLRDSGRVIARAPDLLRPAYPEIGPAVRAAANVAEQTRAARRKAEDVTRTTEEEREAAKAEIARGRASATDAIAKEREVARDELEKQRLAVTADLDVKRADLDRQETEVKKQWSILASLLDRFEPLRKRLMRWLSHPDLPPSMKDEGIGLAAEALSLSVSRGQVDLDP